MRWTTILRHKGASFGQPGHQTDESARSHGPPDFIPENDSTWHEHAESHLLTRGNCVYVLDGIDAQGSACDPNIVNVPCLRPLDGKGRLRAEYRDDLLARQNPGGLLPADGGGGNLG